MLHIILMNRCINQLAPAYFNKSVQRDCTLGYAGTRGSDNPHLFPVRSEWGKCFFVFRASVEWATFPSDIRGIKSAPLFKCTLKSYVMNLLYFILWSLIDTSIDTHNYIESSSSVCIVFVLQDSQVDQPHDAILIK